MKKTLTINLNGYIFNIDNDAYDALNAYFDEISKNFANDERDEIMKDIEARVAELFTEYMIGRDVVIMNDVTRVIDTLGHPEQFSNDSEDTDNSEKIEKEEKTKNNKHKYRKLYRDVDNQLLGGVAAGLAAYFGWDVTIMRLIFVLLLIFGFGWIILIYLIMWILLPEAKTAAQKLEMRGIEPNLENIKNYMQSGQFKETAQRVGNRVGEVILLIIKITLIALCALIGLGFFTVAVGLLIALFVVLIGGSTFFAPLTSTATTAIVLIGVMFLFLCPAIGLVAACIRLIGNNKAPRHRWLGWTLLIVWIISLFAIIGAAIRSDKPSSSEIAQWAQKTAIKTLGKIDESDYISETRSCKDFNSIEVSRAIHVMLTQGDEESIVVKAPGTDLRGIETRVENGVLIITNNNSNAENMPIVYVTAKDINSLSVSEASSVVCDSTLKLNDLHITVNDASHVCLSGEANNVEAKVGEASSADLSKLNAQKFIVEVTEASNASIGTTTTAELKASNASVITYKNGTANLQRDCDESSSITE